MTTSGGNILFLPFVSRILLGFFWDSSHILRRFLDYFFQMIFLSNDMGFSRSFPGFSMTFFGILQRFSRDFVGFFRDSSGILQGFVRFFFSDLTT